MNPENPKTYTEAISELENIVSIMQSDSCDIDSLADHTRRALMLLKFCKEKLTKTDEELKKCLEQLDPQI